MQYHTHITRFILEEQHLYGSRSLGTRKVATELFFEEIARGLGADFWDYTGSRTGHGYGNVNLSAGQQQRGNVRYALADHLGNVRSVITDRKLPTQNGGAVEYAPDVVTSQDYYPFGSLMPERQYANASFANNGYSYGFNGMERDDEWNGVGNSYDFGARIYDARLGRWLARDPLEVKYPFVAPYVFVVNNPLIYIDPDGEKVTPAGAKEVKHLKAFTVKMFGKKSGFKVTSKGITVDEDKLKTFLNAKTTTEEQRRLALRMERVATDKLVETVFHLGTSAVGVVNDNQGRTVESGVPVDRPVGFDQHGNTIYEKVIVVKKVDATNDYSMSDIKDAWTNALYYNKDATFPFAFVVVIDPTYEDDGFDGVNGELIPHNVYATTAHELLGHAYDFYTVSSVDTSFDTENDAREILELEKRTGTDHIDELMDPAKYIIPYK